MKKVIVFIIIIVVIYLLSGLVEKKVDASNIYNDVKNEVVQRFNNRGEYITQEELSKILEEHKIDVINSYKETARDEAVLTEIRLDKMKPIQSTVCN